VFPIRDDNPQVNTPYACYTIIALNALAWFLLQGAGFGEQLNASVCDYGLIPADLFANDSFQQNESFCPPQQSLGWGGVLSSMFMHGSWMHILGNMWFLWVFGDNVEDSMGTARFAIFYVLSGFAAAAAQVWADPSSAVPMVGASGAIGGVMGAYIMLYPRVKVHMIFILIILIIPFRVPAIAMLGYWILVQVVGGISSMGSTGGGVAFWAHVGGFAAGAALIWVFKDEELLLKHPFHGWKQAEDPANVWEDPRNQQ